MLAPSRGGAWRGGARQDPAKTTRGDHASCHSLPVEGNPEATGGSWYPPASVCPFHRSLRALTSLSEALPAATWDQTSQLRMVPGSAVSALDIAEIPALEAQSGSEVAEPPTQAGPKSEQAEQSEACHFQKTRVSRRPLLSGAGVGRAESARGAGPESPFL